MIQASIKDKEIQRYFRSFSISMILLISLFLLPLCLVSFSSANTISKGTEHSWSYNDIWADSEHLNDLVITDILPAVSGNEIITVSDNYYATLITGSGDSWRASRIFKDDFHLRSIGVGDVLPTHPGNELVLAGFSGFVTVLFYDRDNDSWISERIYEDYDWLNDMAVGDIDPSHPGDEIVTVGESRRLSYVYYDSDSKSFSSEIIWKDKDLLNVVTIGNVYIDTPTSEIIVGGGTFNVTILSFENGKWIPDSFWHDSTFIQEIEVAELDSDNNAAEILVAGFSKKLTLLSQNETGVWTGETLWIEKAVINDIITSDFDTDYSGSEVIAISSTGSVAMIYNTGKEWINRTIFTSSKPLTKLSYGDFDLFKAGSEFALLEFKGRLSGLYLEKSDFSFLSPLSYMYVLPGEIFRSDLLVISNGGFSDRVFLNAENTTSFIEVDFESDSLVPTDFVAAEISVSSDIPDEEVLINFVASSETSSRYMNVTLRVINVQTLPPSLNTTGLGLSLEPRITNIVADYSANFVAEVSYNSNLLINNEGSDFITFKIDNAPIGISLEQTWQSALFETNPGQFILTLRSDSGVPSETYYIFIKSEVSIDLTGKDGYIGIERARILQLNVEPLGSPDFSIDISPQRDVIIYPGFDYTWSVGINKYSGFDSMIEFDFTYKNSNIQLNPDKTTIGPEEKMELELTTDEFITPSTYYIVISAQQGDRIRFDMLTVRIEPYDPKLRIEVEPKEQTATKGTVVYYNLTIYPEGGFSGEVEVKLIQDSSANIEWAETTLFLDMESEEKHTELLPFSVGEEGIYHLTFTVESEIGISASDNFTLIVKSDSQNETEDNNTDDGEDGTGSLLNQTQFLTIGVIILIILLMIVLVLKRRTKKAELETQAKDRKKETAKKMYHKRGPGKQRRAGPPPPSDRLPKEVKIEQSRSEKEDYYELGDKVFKPAGSHEYDELKRKKSQ